MREKKVKKIQVTWLVNLDDRDVKIPALQKALMRDSASDVVRFVIDYAYKQFVKPETLRQ